MGPSIPNAADVDPAGLRVRTWVNGELVQDDITADLLFPFAQLVAGLSPQQEQQKTLTPDSKAKLEPVTVLSSEMRARTLRFVPNREDPFKTFGGGYNAQNAPSTPWARATSS